jgi:hypothetical protein
VVILRNLTGSEPIVATSTEAGPADRDESDKQTVAVRPESGYIVVGIILFGFGFALGLFLQNQYHPNMSKIPVLNAGVSIFALLYVYAQAIERFLVPFSWFGGGFLRWGSTTRGTKGTLAKKRQFAVAATERAGSTQETVTEAAKAKHDAEQYSANLTAGTFGIASLLAMAASGYSGVFLLYAVGVHSNGWLDILITGLAVAGGTKPLHDLISNMSSSASAKNDA